MATLPENPAWETGIYQLETTDPVQGGLDGVDNRQAKQLANRTAYLKQKIEDQGAAQTESLANHLLVTDPHPQYINAAELEAKIAALVASSPAALDTLNELANALGNDPNFAATINAAIASKIPLYKAFGIQQSWQDVTNLRALNTIYTNTTEKPIVIVHQVVNGIGLQDVGVWVSGQPTIHSNGGVFNRIPDSGTGSGHGYAMSIVPSGATYKYTFAFSSSSSSANRTFLEFR